VTLEAMEKPDRALLERNIADRLDAGDLRGAADELVRGYGGEVAGYLLALLREESATDEVFSRVCEKLWRGLPAFRRQSSLRTWLYRLAWNAARDFQKEQERTPTRPLRTTEISAIAAEIAASRPPFERSSFADAFTRMRESLDAHEQTLLTLRLHAGLSWKEIGEVLGRKPIALRKRYERLRARLRTEAEAAGLLRR
jgi:RNA polymerase sigma-70 factor (ECF subfamily)